MNNLAKKEQCNIKVIDYYILLDHLYIYYYYFILAYYYPIPALNNAPYPIAMTSSRHRHDIVKTSPLHGDASRIDHRLSPILKVHRYLLADVAPINPRIYPDASPNIRRCIGDAPPKVLRRFAKTSRVSFLVGPHARHRHPSSPEHVIFIASASPEILALVGQ